MQVINACDELRWFCCYVFVVMWLVANAGEMLSVFKADCRPSEYHVCLCPYHLLFVCFLSVSTYVHTICCLYVFCLWVPVSNPSDACLWSLYSAYYHHWFCSEYMSSVLSACWFDVIWRVKVTLASAISQYYCKTCVHFCVPFMWQISWPSHLYENNRLTKIINNILIISISISISSGCKKCPN